MTRQSCRLCGQLGADLPYADSTGEFCSSSCRYRFTADARLEEVPSPGDQVCVECAGWIWTGDPVHELDDRPDIYIHARHRRAVEQSDPDPEPDEQEAAA